MKREQLLQTLKLVGPVTANELHEELELLGHKCVLSSVKKLINDLILVGLIGREGAEEHTSGRRRGRRDTLYFWIADVPGQSAQLQTLPSQIRFKDRKIILLQNLAKNAGGDQRDLLHGVLRDYGVEPE